MTTEQARSVAVIVDGERNGYWYVRPRGGGVDHIVAKCGLRPGHEIPRDLCRVGATGIATYVVRSNGGRWEVREDAESAKGTA